MSCREASLFPFFVSDYIAEKRTTRPPRVQEEARYHHEKPRGAPSLFALPLVLEPLALSVRASVLVRALLGLTTAGDSLSFSLPFPFLSVAQHGYTREVLK